MVYKYDFLIIGAGVAGMSYALKVARANKGKVCLICKTTLDEANTAFAQGGVASVTNMKVDNFEKHIEDTMVAGDYISDRAAVEQVVRNAPSQIAELVNWGVNFDRNEQGEFDLHREGGHSEFRILHHADDTGAEIQRGLMAAVRSNPNIEVKENHFAVEIITQHHLGARVTRRTPYINCYGAYVLNPDTEKVDTYLSRITVMCTGGCGAVYQTTTNPVIATGDGEAMVYRAKGTVKDMEFDSSILPLSIMSARHIPPISSPRRCVAMAESCGCLMEIVSWRSTMNGCHWHPVTSWLVPSTRR
jgi:Aspartate oxidase